MNYNITLGATSPGGGSNANVAVTGDMNLEGAFAVTPGASNQQEAMAITQANIKAVALTFNATPNGSGVPVGGTLTLKTNSSGSPQDTITLYDGIPYIYFILPSGAHSGAPIPFSGNVTAFFMTDGSTGAVGGTLTFKVLTNQ